jgi:hypothetical protein
VPGRTPRFFLIALAVAEPATESNAIQKPGRIEPGAEGFSQPGLLEPFPAVRHGRCSAVSATPAASVFATPAAFRIATTGATT